jgi:glycosyltransferase involved in cell wall biosynthesis
MTIRRVIRRAGRLAKRVYRRSLRLFDKLTRRGVDDVGAEGRLRELTKNDLDAAIHLADDLMARSPNDRELIRAARATYAKAGALTKLLNAIGLERKVRDTEWLQRRETQIRGRLVETSPDWQPLAGRAAQPLTPASPDRILHLLKVSMPYRQSGYTMRAKYTLEGQRAAGLDPVGMTYLGFPRSTGVEDVPLEETVNGIRHARLDVPADFDFDKPFDQLLEDFSAAAEPRVRELAPAVIHAHSGFRGYDLGNVGRALARVCDLPLVYEVRGFFESTWTSNTEISERSETYFRRVDTERRCMLAADAVITLSESMRSEIVARGVTPERVHVVPNGVDVGFFRPREKREDLVEHFDLTDSFVFGYISNLDHYREGQELLVDAAVELRSRGIPARAMIIGDGKRRELLEKYAHEREADDFVTFTGRVAHDEVGDYYALLDVFVVPRVDERAARLVTPLKPYEAMASGVPVVTSDLAALREVTGNGSRGRYFTTGDSRALADVLAQLANDAAGRSAMAVAARDWVVAERQWSANGRRYSDIYEKIIR